MTCLIVLRFHRIGVALLHRSIRTTRRFRIILPRFGQVPDQSVIAALMGSMPLRNLIQAIPYDQFIEASRKQRRRNIDEDRDPRITVIVREGLLAEEDGRHHPGPEIPGRVRGDGVDGEAPHHASVREADGEWNGNRIVAAIFFGKEAFTYDHSYAWIAILVNIPATLFATGFYELVIRDSLNKIAKGHASHEGGDDGLVRHLTKTKKYDPDSATGANGLMEQGYTNAVKSKDT